MLVLVQISLLRMAVGDFNYEDLSGSQSYLGPMLFWVYIFLASHVAPHRQSTALVLVPHPCLLSFVLAAAVTSSSSLCPRAGVLRPHVYVHRHHQRGIRGRQERCAMAWHSKV